MSVPASPVPLPSQVPCFHLATPQEQHRGPGYLACNAQPGEPCRWAARYDGEAPPAFHSERIEAALRGTGVAPACSPKQLRDLVLDSGLV